MVAGWANPTDATAALAVSPASLRERDPASGGLGTAGRQTLGITWSQAFSQSPFPFIACHPSLDCFRLLCCQHVKSGRHSRGIIGLAPKHHRDEPPESHFSPGTVLACASSPGFPPVVRGTRHRKKEPGRSRRQTACLLSFSACCYRTPCGLSWLPA